MSKRNRRNRQRRRPERAKPEELRIRLEEDVLGYAAEITCHRLCHFRDVGRSIFMEQSLRAMLAADRARNDAFRTALLSLTGRELATQPGEHGQSTSLHGLDAVVFALRTNDGRIVPVCFDTSYDLERSTYSIRLFDPARMRIVSVDDDLHPLMRDFFTTSGPFASIQRSLDRMTDEAG